MAELSTRFECACRSLVIDTTANWEASHVCMRTTEDGNKSDESSDTIECPAAWQKDEAHPQLRPVADIQSSVADILNLTAIGGCWQKCNVIDCKSWARE